MCGIPMEPEQKPFTETKIEKMLRHAGATLENQNTALISNYTRQMILTKFQDYMWFDRDHARCTACGAEFGRGNARTVYSVIDSLRHKEDAHCPACGKRMEARNLKYGHSRLQEEFYAVEWRKSAVDKNAVVMIGIYCGMDCRKADAEYAQKTIVPILIDVFEYGKSAKRIQRAVWDWGKEVGETTWYGRRDVRQIGKTYFGRDVDFICSEAGFMRAIEGTPFRGAMEHIERLQMAKGHFYVNDHSELMSAIARRPWIEYMAKAGFETMALRNCWRIEKGLLNPRGKNIREILRLTPDRYAELRCKKIDASESLLKAIRLFDGAGVKLKLAELQEYAKINERNYFRMDELIKLYGKIDRVFFRYTLKHGNEIVEWHDYLRMAVEAGIDMTAKDAKTPVDLKRAHDEMVDLRNAAETARKKAAAEKKQDGLEKRLQEWEKRFAFEHEGLVLFPARKLVDLIDEGNRQNICVGAYVNSYAEGRTVICFLRKSEEPDKPWRTVEIDPKTGRVVQDRGYANDRNGIPGEVKAQLNEFWSAWEKRGKINKKSA